MTVLLQVQRLKGFGLVTQNTGRLTEFYERAFGSRLLVSERVDGPAAERSLGVAGGGHRSCLGLGSARIDVLQFDRPGKPYPEAVKPWDRAFQHFALVVGDMESALAQLSHASGWEPISSDGPEVLPARSGGVTAYKFRDPDGHPLELLQFPANAIPAYWSSRLPGTLFAGIDHSAISVMDTDRSIAFYQTLGLQLTAQTTNVGTEQARLDGVPDPHVEVTALSPPNVTPHVELLCYRAAGVGSPNTPSSNDVAATRLIFEGAGEQHIVDPDGHHIQFVS